MTKRRKTKSRRREERGNQLGLIAISLVVIALAVTVGINSRSLKAKDTAYAQREELLEKQVKEEEYRNELLEEQRIYVQTKQYIEEAAKEKLGLINPDEILLKPIN